jgi:diguanylate cyclase (GGDEF)-like protein
MLNRRVRAVVAVLFACGGLVTLGHFLRQLSVVVHPLIWSSIQIIIALVSFTIAATVLVRFHGTGNRVLLLLGLTFTISALIHMGAIAEFYRHFLVRAEQLRVPLAWMIGQTLLGLLFLIAYAADGHLRWPREIRGIVIVGLAIIALAFSLITTVLLTFPHEPPIRPQSALPRPWDLLPAVIFVAAALVLRHMIGGDRYAFDRALVWVAGMNAASHLIASQSARLLDAPEAAAQLLIMVSYVTLLGATLWDNARLFGQVRTLAISDSLTGLANYRRLIDILQSELDRSGRTNRSFSLLLMDLDGLKLVNDQHGHLAGSRALCRVADVLRLHCRSIDTAARYGGDEFALVLPEANELAAQQVAMRIRTRLEEESEEPRLALSTGSATFPRDGATVSQLLEAADRALYAMKLESKRGSIQNAGR